MIEIGRAEDLCRQMDDLADEDHTHHGGFVRTRLVPIPCQSGTDLTSNKLCLPCGNRKKKKKKLNETNDGDKAILRLGGAGKEHGGLLIPTKLTMEMYQLLNDQGNLINK